MPETRNAHSHSTQGACRQTDAMLVAAPEVANSRRLNAALDISEIERLSDTALLAKVCELQRLDRDSGDLTVDDPAHDEAMRVQSKVIDCMDAIAKELVRRPTRSMIEAKRKAEALMICCPCTFECPDPGEKIVADFIRGIVAFDDPRASAVVIPPPEPVCGNQESDSAASIAALTELRQLAGVARGVDAIDNDLMPAEPGRNEVGDAGRNLFKRMEALAFALLERPVDSLNDAKNRAEAIALCWPSLLDDAEGDPRDEMVAALLRSIMRAGPSPKDRSEAHRTSWPRLGTQGPASVQP